MTQENYNSSDKVITTCLFSIIAGFLAGVIYSKHLYEPKTLRLRDLNGDGIQDIVVVDCGFFEYKTVFLGQRDGTYKRLGVLQKEIEKEAEKNVEGLESKVKGD